MKRFIFIVLAVLFCCSTPCYAVVDGVAANGTIEINGIDGANLDWVALCTSEGWAGWSDGIRVSHVVFTPGAAADNLILREGSLTGPKWPGMLTLSGESRSIKLDGKKTQLYIDYDESGQVISSGAYITIFLIGY